MSAFGNFGGQRILLQIQPCDFRMVQTQCFRDKVISIDSEGRDGAVGVWW